MNLEPVWSTGVAIGGGFFAGILIGYALKKIVKLVAIVVGLFFVALAYLQYQQIVNINWNKLQIVSQNAGTTLANTTTQIPGIGGNLITNGNQIAAIAMTNFGILLNGSMAMGFGIGFMKG